MILIHRTDTLIKLIIRTVLRSLNVSHAGIFLYDKNKNSYILNITKGDKGAKVPSGLLRISGDSALIKYFLTCYTPSDSEHFLITEKIQSQLKSKRLEKDPVRFQLFEQLYQQLRIYKIKIAIPIFFRDEFFGVFVLGGKKNKKKFQTDELMFLSILSSDVAMAIRNASLFEDLSVQLERNQNLFVQTIATLAEAIEAKDHYTSGHTKRVVNYSLAIAEELRKLRKIRKGKEFMNNLRIAALLHDIGKIGIPEGVLNKEEPLTESDWQSIKTHPLVGEGILSPIKELQPVILGVKYHHERYDGGGYPQGLPGKKIPLIAAVIAVADAYDAMTTDRPYRRALTHDEAVAEIKKNDSLQFHPQVVQAFVAAFSR